MNPKRLHASVAARCALVAEGRQLRTKLATRVENAAFDRAHRDAQFLGDFIVVKSLHEHVEWHLELGLKIIDGTADVLLINYGGYSIRLHRS